MSTYSSQISRSIACFSILSSALPAPLECPSSLYLSGAHMFTEALFKGHRLSQVFLRQPSHKQSRPLPACCCTQHTGLIWEAPGYTSIFSQISYVLQETKDGIFVPDIPVLGAGSGTRQRWCSGTETESTFGPLSALRAWRRKHLCSTSPESLMFFLSKLNSLVPSTSPATSFPVGYGIQTGLDSNPNFLVAY